MVRPLITCIVLTYNQEHFVGAAVAGVLSQSYEPLEIIISDDCSTDNTFPVVEKLVDRYSGPHRVRLHRQPSNIGIAGQVNWAMSVSNGEYVVAAAGDDVSLPYRCDTVWRYISDRGREVKALYTKVQIIDRRGRKVRTWGGPPREDLKSSLVARATRCTAGVIGASLAWHREVFDKFGPLLPSSVGEDQAIGFRAYGLGTVGFLREITVLYRIHERNMSTFHPSEMRYQRENYERRQARWIELQLGKITQFLSDLENDCFIANYDEVEIRTAKNVLQKHRQRYTLMKEFSRAGPTERRRIAVRALCSNLGRREKMKMCLMAFFPFFWDMLMATRWRTWQ